MGFHWRVVRPRRSFFVMALFTLICYQTAQMSNTFFPTFPSSAEEYFSNLPKATNRSSIRSDGILIGGNDVILRIQPARKIATVDVTEDTNEPYYQSLQSLHGKLRCWNTELRCEKLRNQTGGDLDGRSDTNDSDTTVFATGKKTLALVDPSLRDGYRNQFMRFVAFTAYALTNGFEQILLPSIRWNCDHRRIGSTAVPFELLFDVEHWNNDPDLPTLVNFNESEHFDWNPFTGLFRGACDVLSLYLSRSPSVKYILLARAEKYHHPVPYGGGNTLGTLFHAYLNYDARRPRLHLSGKNTTTSFIDVEAKITRAMRPSARIERLLRETLGGNNQPPGIALHARFEPDMLVHSACKRFKVYNLTDVFDMIRGMDLSNITTNPSMYIAINMAEMMAGNQYKWFRNEHRLNMAALRGATTMGLALPLSGTNLTVSVGGHTAFRSDEIDSCAHEIVSSVISFEIAVRAKIFIGTYVSSWSTTVWKARHYLGHGENYAYTPNGLERIEGVPKPFRC